MSLRPARFYIWFFRGTPGARAPSFRYNISAVYPSSLGVVRPVPFIHSDREHRITRSHAAILVPCLNNSRGAYISEIVRAGIISVDPASLRHASALA